MEKCSAVDGKFYKEGSMRLHMLGCITASHIGSLDVFLVKSKASRPMGRHRPPITLVTFLWGRIGIGLVF